ncbi:MAG TPA: hypothetical protein DDW77_14515 [Verrucomicrobiales bacterium]|nr:hypothetical protein [Pedosphaera sp.]HBF04373.1 hypothetical protein [Verrucomicrobiales bacterium]
MLEEVLQPIHASSQNQQHRRRAGQIYKGLRLKGTNAAIGNIFNRKAALRKSRIRAAWTFSLFTGHREVL